MVVRFSFTCLLVLGLFVEGASGFPNSSMNQQLDGRGSGQVALVAEGAPDSGTGDAASAPETRKSSEYLGAETLEACMARWDEGTHMTNSAWRQTCERVAKERAPYVTHE
jgi:hypothetical protein